MSKAGDPIHEARLEEFRALRAEMLSIIDARLWGQVTYGALAGGVLAFAAKAYRAPSFAFLIVVAIPLLLHTILREHARIRMANYIRAALEPNVPGFAWEAYVGAWRSRRGGERGWLGRVDRLKHIFSLSGLYLVVSMFCLSLLFREPHAWVARAVGLVASTLLGLVYWYFFRLYSNGATEFAELKRDLADLDGRDLREFLEDRNA